MMLTASLELLLAITDVLPVSSALTSDRRLLAWRCRSSSVYAHISLQRPSFPLPLYLAHAHYPFPT